MAEQAPKIESKKGISIYELASKISALMEEYKKKTGRKLDYIVACDAVFDAEHIPRDFNFRLNLKRKISPQLNIRKVLKTEIKAVPSAREIGIQPPQKSYMEELQERRKQNIIKKIEEEVPLFAEQEKQKEKRKGNL